MKLPNTTLVLLRNEEQVLLAMKKRGFGIGKYNGVGGKLEPGETIQQAAIRECEEEVGIIPSALKQVAELTFHYDQKPNWDQVVHVFISTEYTGDAIETEEMKPSWFNLADIPYDSMWPDDEIWLPKVLDGQYVTATFWFAVDGTMTRYELG